MIKSIMIAASYSRFGTLERLRRIQSYRAVAKQIFIPTVACYCR